LIISLKATTDKNIKEIGKSAFTKNLYSKPPGFEDTSFCKKLRITKSIPIYMIKNEKGKIKNIEDIVSMIIFVLVEKDA